MSTTRNTITVSTSTFSNSLLSRLAVSPSKFARMLGSKRSSTEIASVANVSARTVQRYRRSLTTTSV